MQNISGFGLIARLVASASFPAGFTVTEFADDTDPLDSPDLEAADTSMGLNGDLIVWSRPQGLEISMAVIPASAADDNLFALLEANRVGKGKRGARDIITVALSYPTGETGTMANGTIVSGPVLKKVASTGRFKTNVYKFRFESLSKTGQTAR